MTQETSTLPAFGSLILLLLLALGGPTVRAQTPTWQTVLGAGGNESQVRASAPDGSGNVYLAGQFTGTVSFGSTTLSSAGGQDVFVAKWSSASNSFVWAERAGGPLDDLAQALAVSGSAVYVAGTFQSATLPFGSSSLANAGSYDAFVARLTDGGSTRSWDWARSFGGSGSDAVGGLGANGSTVYVAGSFSSSVFFGPSLLTAAGGTDVFVVQLTDQGSSSAVGWSRRMGGPGADYPRALAVSGTSLYVAGSFSGTANFTNTTLASFGLQDVFVSKLTDLGSTGQAGWTCQAGGADMDEATALAVSGTNVYLTGYFFSPTASFGSSTLPNTTPSLPSSDLFVARIADGGASSVFSWAQKGGGSGNDGGQGLAVSGSNVYVTGYFDSSTASFGSSTLTRTGSGLATDLVIAKLAESGNSASFSWAAAGGGAGADQPTGLSVRGSLLTVTGFATPAASFGSQQLSTPAGTRVALVATLEVPAVNAQCFFWDDYADPTLWTQVGTGIAVQNGQVVVASTRGGSTASAQRGIYRPLPAPLNDNGGWRAEIDLTYNGLNGGLNSGLQELTLAAGTRHPLNDFPGGVQVQTNQDCISIITTGSLGSPVVPLKILASDNGVWTESPLPLTLRQGTTTYLRLERLNATMVKLSAFTDAARTVHQAGSPLCLVIPASIVGLNTVWHNNVPQGSPDRNDNATLDNLCLTAIPILDPTLAVQASAAPCAGTPISLSGTVSYPSLRWTLAGSAWTATGNPVQFTPPAAGTYVFTAQGTLAEFCAQPVTQTVSVTVGAPPAVALSYGGTTFCQAGLSAAPSFGPAGGTFSGTAGLVVNVSTGVINLAASAIGTHTLTYTTGGPCPGSSTASLTITPLVVPTLAYVGTAFCQPSPPSAAPTVSPAGGTFTGSAGLVIDPSTGVINVNASTLGPHTASYTGGGACPGTRTLAITINPGAALSYPATTFCQTGLSAAPTFSPAGGTFSGTPGLVVNPATGIVDLGSSTVGAHAVSYVIGGFCTGQQTVALTINPVPAASLSYGSTVLCQDASTATPTFSPAGGLFSGTPGLVLNPATGVVDLSNSASGSHTVTYQGPGTCGARASVALLLFRTPAPVLSNQSTSLCQVGFSPGPTVSPPGGTFTGTPGLVVDPSTGAINLGSSTAGQHTLTYSVGGPCPRQANVLLTISPAPQATLRYATSTFCQAGRSPSPQFSPVGGTFSSPTGLVLDPSTGSIDLTASPAGTHTVTYAIPGTCPSTAQAVVNVAAPAPATLAYGSSFYCSGMADPSPTVNPAGGTFTAGVGLVLDAGTGRVDLAASRPGTYLVSYTSPGPCLGTANFTLTITPDTPAALRYDNASACQAGLSGRPQASPAGGSFSAAAGLVIDAANGVINQGQSQPGRYSIRYTTPGPCPAEARFDFSILAPPASSLSYGSASLCQAGLSPVPVVSPAGGRFTGSAGLVLDSSTGQLNLAASTAGPHTVTYASPGSCPSQTTTSLRVEPAVVPLFPNVLTPNGDGLNDVLLIRGPDGRVPAVDSYQLLVFSRWGQPVWRSSSPAAGWDAAGTSAGLYYYRVQYTDCQQQPRTYQGWVEVIR